MTFFRSLLFRFLRIFFMLMSLLGKRGPSSVEAFVGDVGPRAASSSHEAFELNYILFSPMIYIRRGRVLRVINVLLNLF